MYSIWKRSHYLFGNFSKPSLGAIKPALTRLEKLGYISSRKSMSEGGKQSGFYSITDDGHSYLKQLLCDKISDNPLQFVSNAYIKLSCLSYLPKQERNDVLIYLKKCTLSHKFDAEKSLEENKLDFYQRVVIDNLIVQYNNLVSLIENLEKDLERN